MKQQPVIIPNIFGEIKIGESTGLYIAKSGQGETIILQIKMYPTEPDNIASVELPNHTMSSDTLLATFKDKIIVCS